MQWLVAVGSEQYVAESIDQLASWLREGRIQWTSYVYLPSSHRWIPAHEIPELRQLFANHQRRAPSSPSSPALITVIGCGVAFLLLFAILAAVVGRTPESKAGGSPEDTSQVSATGIDAEVTPSANTTRAQSDITEAKDYQSGYNRGRAEGSDHARSGAGMPIPLGMNWMADLQSQAARPSDVDAWKRGFKAGFEDGFKSITSFNRDESLWEQLSWDNAQPGVKLYEYGGKHEATIRGVDRSSGIIVVRYRSGEVEPKDLAAVAPYWWVRKK